MSSIELPYNFVPFAPRVLEPTWANQVSHDRPFQDGYRGEIEVVFTNLTKICAAGKQQESTTDAPGKAEFFRIGPNPGIPALPNTALKGMLRSIMKVIAFGKQDQVEDRKFAVRDITNSRNFYFQHLQSQHTKAGFLRFDQEKGTWQIVPCQKISRVHQEDIINALASKGKDMKSLQHEWNDNNKGKAISSEIRYKIMGGVKEVAIKDLFERKTDKRMAVGIDRFQKDTGHYLVVTGQPGKTYDFSKPREKNIKIKQWEFIFSGPDESKTLTLSKNTVKDFLFVHNKSSEWAFLKSKLSDTEFLPQGIPVFYRTNGSDVEHMGLASMYRLSYKYSTQDIIKRQDPRHLDAQVQDLASLLFGFSIDNDDDTSLKSRINISHAVPDQPVSLTMSRPTVLGAPKPSFYPSYLQQSANNSFTSYMDKHVLLSGQKFYNRSEAQLPAPSDPNNKKVQVQLELAPENIRWKAKIRFHNLRSVELGALLWVLTLNNESTHQLGMAKAFGFGQLTAATKLNWCKANDEAQPPMQEELAKGLFVEYMNKASDTLFNQPVWLETPTMKQFFEVTKPTNTSALKYPEPKIYQDSKTSKGELSNFTYANYFKTETNEIPVSFYPDAVEYRTILANKEAQEKEKIEFEKMLNDIPELERLIIVAQKDLQALIASGKPLNKNTLKSLESKLRNELKAAIIDDILGNNARSLWSDFMVTVTQCNIDPNSAFGKIVKQIDRDLKQY